MPKIACLPDTTEFSIGEDETILEASLRANIAHAHACGGLAPLAAFDAVQSEYHAMAELQGRVLEPERDAAFDVRDERLDGFLEDLPGGL